MSAGIKIFYHAQLKATGSHRRTTDGVTQNPDGSVTIYIQHTRPDGGRAANWLPAPEGSFNLTMRYYAPPSSVLDKT